MIIRLSGTKQIGTYQKSLNKSLQRTFDPPPIYAAAKTGIASNAAKLRRYEFEN